MAINTPVVDRVSTYPGRVKLTAVSGQTDVYDMVRADEPVQEGTPLNKELLDQKAYTLTSDVTVYVSTTGSDADGDGSSAAPYATIQTALDALPRFLGGYQATINIASGTYEERVNVDGFSGGRLVIGVAGRTVVVRGLSISNSAHVSLNISNVTWATGYSDTIFLVSHGSSVTLTSGMTVRCAGSNLVGVGVTNGAELMSAGTTITVLNCAQSAIRVTLGGRAALSTITGSGNTDIGLLAEVGGILSYNTSNLTSTGGNVSRTGGRILSGSGSDLSAASVG